MRYVENAAFYYFWRDRTFLNLTKMDELRYVEIESIASMY
jgi:hypothetical protein